MNNCPVRADENKHFHSQVDSTEWNEEQIFEAAEYVVNDKISKLGKAHVIGDLSVTDSDVDRMEAMQEAELMDTLQTKASVFWKDIVIEYLEREEARG